MFWALDADRPGGYPPGDALAVRERSGVRMGDAHDPTRVLRVPGDELQEPGVLSDSRHTKAKYLSVFPPKTRVVASGRMVSIASPKEPLGDALRAEFAAIWQPGQRHQAALAIAGFMRCCTGRSWRLRSPATCISR